ncbi:MAG: HDOD domain-containing protein [Phycisphaerae bacterium]|nr:HDOD domain-containing protein [Phycisphaerae bacterium]
MTTSTALDIANETLEIATLPEVTMRIVQVVQDPKSTAHDLHVIVKNDPALSARVLRVVNSAFYGLPGQIGSIDRAIMLLGLNAVKNIAIAASLSKMFKTNTECPEFSGKDLWTHSVAVGATNKLIASAIGLSLPDESFLAGLMHDIGLVSVMQCRASAIPEIIAQVNTGKNLLEVESEILGATHTEIGAALTTRWKFPRSFQYVTAFHHNPMELAPENRLLATVTCIADSLCTQMGLGLFNREKIDDIVIDDYLIKEISISPNQLNEIANNIEEELEVVKALIE